MTEKKGIIFDFDDTLVYTNIMFNEIKAAFEEMMQGFGLYDEKLSDILNKFDIANVEKRQGYAKECFPHALKQTYAHYSSLYARPVHSKEICQIEALGSQIYQQKPRLLEGAESLLADLQAEYKLLLLTKGDPILQKSRVLASGLSPYFTDVRVVWNKTATDFQKVLAAHGLQTAQTWSVGNSIKSDINPALEAGLACILLQVTDMWDYEDAEAIGSYALAKSFEECRMILQGNSYRK